MDTKIPDGPPGVDLHPTSKCPHVVLGVSSTAPAQAHPDDGVHYLQQVFLNTCRELWTIPEGAIATTAANYFSHDPSKYISFGVVTQFFAKVDYDLAHDRATAAQRLYVDI